MDDQSAVALAVEEDESTSIQFESTGEISKAWYLATHPEEDEESPDLP